MKIHSPILITGSIRSGTTYTGKMFSFSNEVVYLWEPFQKGIKSLNDIGIFDYWHTYLEKESPDKFIKFINEYSKLEIKDLSSLKTIKKEKIIYQSLQLYKKIMYNLNLQSYRLLFKDPIAFFSTEWFYNNFKDSKIIIMIRNPISFVNSLKKLDWELNFEDLYNQKKLMNTLSPNIVKMIELDLLNELDVVDKGILFWNIVYKQVIDWESKHANYWKFVKLEDLSNNLISLLNSSSFKLTIFVSNLLLFSIRSILFKFSSLDLSSVTIILILTSLKKFFAFSHELIIDLIVLNVYSIFGKLNILILF